MKNSNLIFACDIGGTTIKFGIVDLKDNKIQYNFSIPTQSEISPIIVIENIIKGIDKLTKVNPEINYIGIGVPGVINDNNEVCYPPNFNGWNKVPLYEILKKNIGEKFEIRIDNDAKTAALSEFLNCGKNISDMIFITLGTGVGGCIISKGKIFRGFKGGAGEIGHVSIDYKGLLCKCGSRGCIESYLGQKFMSDQATDELKDNPDSILVDMIKFNKMEPKLINKAAEQNDKFAIEFLRKRGAMLGSVIASVMNLLDIHLTIIGGGTSESNILISSTKEEMNSRLLKSIQPTSELRLAKYLKDSGVIGAANLFKILS